MKLQLWKRAKKKNPQPRKSLPSKLIVVLVLPLVGWSFYVLAQSTSDAVVSHRAELQRQLNALEQEIASYQTLVDQKRQEAASLERDVAILDGNIKKAQLEIRAINLAIQELEDKIVTKEVTIDQIAAKVDREKLSLAEFMRTLEEHDDVSVLEIMLSYDKVSDFLSDTDSIDIIQQSLQDSFTRLGAAKKLEEDARDELIDQKQEKTSLRNLQELAKRQIESNERDKKNLLRLTRGKESEYQKTVFAKQKNVASIRSQLFLLQGSSAIPFEKAVLFAERASAKTGVRTAFILGVIAQESDLGKNIGQCNLPDDPPKFKWQQIMKPTRDQEPYRAITAKLGLDPNLMPLSCPLSVGWGGAMGPAQFIPSTWLLYEPRIAEATGHAIPNPWEPEDAFMAAAIYLGGIGASTPAGEHDAAAKYFAGLGWNGFWGRTYASQVLEKVATYQGQLDLLKGLASR